MPKQFSFVSYLSPPVAAALLLLTIACAPKVEEKPGVALTEVAFSDLPGFAEDPVIEALPALRRSCERFLKMAPEKALGLGGQAGDWRPACSALRDPALGEPELRSLLVTEFRAFAVSAEGESEGLFTGYYEPEIAGSRTPLAAPATALLGPPKDMITIDLALFDDAGEGKLTGRLEGKRLLPYHDRAGIEAGALRGQDLAFLWIADPIDAFFLHIQGSGRVRLADGSVVRVGYAGSNGRRYTAIGRPLIERGAIPREAVSLQSIRAWLRDNPAERDAVMGLNARYIFFRELTGPGPLGAFGVALTPGRSLAIDATLLPLGAPIFLDTRNPLDGRPLRRLVAAQDRGAAIKGAVRGDLFWGAGAEAEAAAGTMKEPGRAYLLLPRAAADRLTLS